MSTPISEALRLAEILERPGYGWHSTPAQVAAELRRLAAVEKAQQWQPIETAPENMDALAVVRWVDNDGQEHHDLDHKEDGCWRRWHDHAEHVEVIGGWGVSYVEPYTHWMPLPAPPAA